LEGKEFIEKNKWEGRAVDEDALLNKKVLTLSPRSPLS
jgi:hypothetical protein